MSLQDILFNLSLAFVATELLGLSTVLAYALVKWAAKLYIPEPYRQDAENEWLSHIEGMKSHVKVWQLWAALDIFLRAAPKISRQYKSLKPYVKVESRKLQHQNMSKTTLGLIQLIGGLLGGVLIQATDNRVIQVGIATQLIYIAFLSFRYYLHKDREKQRS